MAEGTRLKSLEEHVKKQEARLQDAMKALHASQQQFRAEIGS